MFSKILDWFKINKPRRINQSFEYNNRTCPFAKVNKDVCCSLVKMNKCDKNICPLLKSYELRGEEGDY